MTELLKSKRSTEPLVVRVYEPAEIDRNLCLELNGAISQRLPSEDLRWLLALKAGLDQQPYCVVVYRGESVAAVLPLMNIESWLFGKHLVSLPYLNLGGLLPIQSGNDPLANQAAMDAAIVLADKLNVNHLQLRHLMPIAHAAINEQIESKVQMHLTLPSTADEFLSSLKSKVRSQIKKGESHPFDVSWGREELLDSFYKVFARNMRDLGTPVFGKKLFRSILESFSTEAEICILKLDHRVAGAALLVHGQEVTEVPSASTVRSFNPTNANMVMYWNLLQRTIARGQTTFDFGRSTLDSGTYRFKRQWGASPVSTCWQYYCRTGSATELRPDDKNFAWKIAVWKKLPVWLTRLAGPAIVRGIP